MTGDRSLKDHDQPEAFKGGHEKNFLWLHHSGSWTSVELLKDVIEVRQWNEERNDGSLDAVIPVGVVYVYHEHPIEKDNEA